MMSNQDNENYIKLHKDALESVKKTGGTAEEIEFLEKGLNDHITLEEVEDESSTTSD